MHAPRCGTRGHEVPSEHVSLVGRGKRQSQFWCQSPQAISGPSPQPPPDTFLTNPVPATTDKWDSRRALVNLADRRSSDRCVQIMLLCFLTKF